MNGLTTRPLSLVPDHMRPRREPVRRPRLSDVPLMEELVRRHDHYNAMLFGGQLSRIVIRISGRMRIRLGQYSVPEFRRKAREAGIEATARRVVMVDTAPLQKRA